jgi:hypothetical protein
MLPIGVGKLAATVSVTGLFYRMAVRTPRVSRTRTNIYPIVASSFAAVPYARRACDWDRRAPLPED